MLVMRLIVSNLFTALFICLIFLTKRLLGERLSAKYHYYIWFLLLPSLGMVLVPSSVLRNFSAPAMLYEGIAASSVRGGTDDIHLGFSASIGAEDITDTLTDADRSAFCAFLLAVWLAGVLIAAGIYLHGFIRLRAIHRKGVFPPRHQKELFQRCCLRVGIREEKWENIVFLQSDLLSVPCSFGVKKQYVIVPGFCLESLREREVEHILLHELTHVRHRDNLVNSLFCAVQAIFWFHPFLWGAVAQMRQDREIYCDWSVLGLLRDDEARRDYGQTLLRFAARDRMQNLYTVSGLCGNREGLKRRILCITNFRRESRRTSLRGVLVLCVAACVIIFQLPVLSAFSSDRGDVYRPEDSMTVIDHDFSRYFSDVPGCAVVYDQEADRYEVYDRRKAFQRVSPCSTYKIYSGLNALEEGLISPDHSVIPWNGTKYAFSSWNQEQNLSSAMQRSVNWYFSELDRRSGIRKLEEFYRKIGYGNEYVGKDTETYWNGSALKISAVEQTELLKKFYHNEFGFKEENVSAVKEAMLVAQSGDVRLYGKTGTGSRGTEVQNGWFVGFAEKGEKTLFFAVSLQSEDGASGGRAMEIACEILREKGIYVTV